MKRAEVKKMLKAMITLAGPDAFQECVEEYLSQKGDTRVNLLRCNAMMTEEEMPYNSVIYHCYIITCKK